MRRAARNNSQPGNLTLRERIQESEGGAVRNSSPPPRDGEASSRGEPWFRGALCEGAPKARRESVLDGCGGEMESEALEGSKCGIVLFFEYLGYVFFFLLAVGGLGPFHLVQGR